MTTQLHPPLQFILDDSNWLDYSRFESSTAFAVHCESLSRRGLFTDHLANLACGKVSVELVQQGPIPETQDMNRRDVRIKVGDSLAAIASTLISDQVMLAESWLDTLGNKPIGEMLESRLSAERTDIRYAPIASDSRMFENFSDEAALWGRRYRYQFDSGQLSITEIIADSIVMKLFERAPFTQQ